jgi:parallel beta-helix repeat protein
MKNLRRTARAATVLAAALLAPATVAPHAWAASPHDFTITPGTTATSYEATSDTGQVLTGSLKEVVESAVAALGSAGGRIAFTAGTFDLGSDHFEFYSIADVEFAGAGADLTLIRNSNSSASDTEPFDFTGADRVRIRDLAVSAGGSLRSTSDAIDFDRGNDSSVEGVKVVGSRGRGIVFDGKGSGWTADRNVVRDCVIVGVPSDGIELLASRGTVIQGCTITDVGGHGIQITKASTQAAQRNKTSDDNQLLGNVVTNSGHDGINVNSGNRNLIEGNTILNSSDDTSGRDGIRISASDSIACDDNVVRSNTATDTGTPKTQRYGVNIASSLCHRTVLSGNLLQGNRTGELRDAGTGTIVLTQPDTEAPRAPESLSAVAVSSGRVDLAWPAATDNVAVVSYVLYRDGAMLTSVPGGTLSYSDASVGPATTYLYEVVAVDAAQLESAPTAAAPVTTPEVTGATEWTPVADAYVSAASPNSAYGTSTSLRADNDPVVRTYLRFEVSGSAPGPHRTILRLYALSTHNTGVQVRSVAGGGWTESVTFNTAPSVGDVIGSSGPLVKDAFVEIDLGGLVTADGTYELALTGTTTTAVSMASRESAFSPRLLLLEP